MILLGLDPGTTHTGCVWFDGGRVFLSSYMENERVLVRLRDFCVEHCNAVACEMFQCQGMPVGKETFETAEKSSS